MALPQAQDPDNAEVYLTSTSVGLAKALATLDGHDHTVLAKGLPITTAALATNAVSGVYTGSGGASAQTVGPSADWVDTGASVLSFTSSGGYLFIFATGSASNTVSGALNQFAVSLDSGGKTAVTKVTNYGVGGYMGFSGVVNLGQIAAGVHTAHLWFQTNNGTLTLDTVAPQLFVVELKR